MSELETGPVEALEALLFVSEGPQELGVLSRALGLTDGQAEQALELLAQRLEDRGAIMLVRLAGGYQLSTKPHFSELVAQFLKPQKQRLRRSLLEVLAVVAYRQPVTIAEIERIRGVQSDHSVRTLLERRLLRECGRKKALGRPILYGTSQLFLHQFNLNSLDDLPTLSRSMDPVEGAQLFSLEELR